jgi:DNA-binding IclR family transcriptional regulator
MQNNDTDYTIHNVKKALEILEKLAESQVLLTVDALAESICFPRAKTFRLLATLSEKGLVERHALSGGYQIGKRTAVFAKKLLGSSKKVHEGQPVMQKLVDSSNLVSYSHPIMERLARKTTRRSTWPSSRTTKCCSSTWSIAGSRSRQSPSSAGSSPFSPTQPGRS